MKYLWENLQQNKTMICHDRMESEKTENAEKTQKRLELLQ